MEMNPLREELFKAMQHITNVQEMLVVYPFDKQDECEYELLHAKHILYKLVGDIH